ncbi:hypothetical protein KC318_g13224 [Hortaea werneckii]|nr:hypothetical protein KC334_g6532 [Hortaea werneckii]KAI7009620.1 hypothetical protein KC355_g6479 [Hortaea werneckii]KAI7655028.1 hypothetical protein KC318_g13224 [Hortaea werneckii]
MAEPFSIATGALQVAGAGFQVVKTLAAYIQAANGFDKSVAAIQLEVKVTSSTLESLSALLNDHEAEKICSTKIIGDAKGVFKGCFAAFDEVDQVFRNVVKTGNDGKKPSLSAGARLKWPLKKGKVETLQANLERLKTTLLLMLSVLSFAREKARRLIVRHNLTSDAKRAFIEKLQIRGLIRSEELARERYGALAARLGAAEKCLPTGVPGSSSRAIDQGPGTHQDAHSPGPSGTLNNCSSLLEHLEACTSAVASLTHALDSARRKYIAESLFQLQDVDLPWQALGTAWGRLEAFDGEHVTAISESSIQHCNFDPPTGWDSCMGGEGSVVQQKVVDGRYLRAIGEGPESNHHHSPEIEGGETRLTQADYGKASSTGTEQAINEQEGPPSPIPFKSQSTPEHQNLNPIKEDGLEDDRIAKDSRPLIRRLSREATNRLPRRRRRRPQSEGPPLLRRCCDSNVTHDNDFELELEDAQSSKEATSSASSSSSPSGELSTTPSRPEPQPHSSPLARVPSNSPPPIIPDGSSQAVDDCSPQDSQQDPPERRRSYAQARNNMKPPSTILIKPGKDRFPRITCRVVLKTDRMPSRKPDQNGEGTGLGGTAVLSVQEDAGEVITAGEGTVTRGLACSEDEDVDDGMGEVDALISRWTTLQV